MLSLVIIESALELVPKTIQNHSSIISHAKKLEKNPSDILLDNSWHFAAMKGIENEFGWSRRTWRDGSGSSGKPISGRRAPDIWI